MTILIYEGTPDRLQGLVSTTTLEDFFAVNADAFGDGEPEAIRDAIENGEQFVMGGGAGGSFTIMSAVRS
jgi:hypothetical protein